MRSAFIEDHRTVWPIVIPCRLLVVSRSGYYQWRRRPVSERAKRRESLTAAVRKIHVGHRQSDGSPCVPQELRAQGEAVNEKTVAKVLREAGLRAKSDRQFRVRNGCITRRLRLAKPPARACSTTSKSSTTANAATRPWATCRRSPLKRSKPLHRLSPRPAPGGSHGRWKFLIMSPCLFHP